MEISKKTGEGKMDVSYHRHDINEKVWELLEPHLPGQRGQWGGIAQDNRRFINAVFWVLRTGAPWCDLPPGYGKWGSVHLKGHYNDCSVCNTFKCRRMGYRLTIPFSECLV